MESNEATRYLCKVISRVCRKMSAGKIALITIGFILFVGAIIAPMAIILTAKSSDGILIPAAIGVSMFVLFVSLIMIIFGFMSHNCKRLKDQVLAALQRLSDKPGVAAIKETLQGNSASPDDVMRLLRNTTPSTIDMIYQNILDKQREAMRSNRRRYAYDLD